MPNSDPVEVFDSNLQYVALNFAGVPTRGLLGFNSPADTGDGQVYAISTEHADYAGDPIACEIETYEVDLSSFWGVKEITSLKLIYKQTGSVNVKLIVHTRNSQAVAFTVSETLELNTQLEDKFEFYFRARGVGQFIKFQIMWDNTDTDYISEIYGLSLKVKVPVEHDVQK